jgi:CBS domain-containing protein/uncharacterized protein (DUF2267 family)
MNESLKPFVERRKPVILRTSSKVYEAAKAMEANNVGSVIVSNAKGSLVGLVTDRDLMVSTLSKAVDDHSTLSEFVEDRELFCITEDQSVSDAVQLMQEKGVRRIPIVHLVGQERAQCSGIITVDDLIVNRKVSVDDLVKIIEKQVHSPMPLKRTEALKRSRARSESRREQTYRHFIGELATQTGLQEPSSEELAKLFLSSLVRRVDYNEAYDLISQLPARLKDDLLALEAGPDRTFTAQKMIRDVSNQLNQGELESKHLIQKAWQTLGTFIERGELEDVLSQLPKETVELLEPDRFRKSA